jgi:ribonuclease HII
MPLLIAGIDEAGYGPMLGPLCVGLCVVRLDAWAHGDPPPDLWDLLARAVARSSKDAAGRIPIADSKELKLPNDGKRHPLTHLERGVLAVARTVGLDARDDLALFDRLGVELDDHDCYAGPSIPLPAASDPALLAIAANTLAGACAAAGVRFERLACLAVPEARFNQIVSDERSKAQATLWALGQHIRAVARQWGGQHAWVVCDRLGGRTAYADSLRRELPGLDVDTVEESPHRSVYRVHHPAGGPPMVVTFRTAGEKAQLPVALASMTAKYVRELAMARFNRHWSARMPELKPTAGYVQDARRWLEDARPLLTDDDRRRLIRRA